MSQIKAILAELQAQVPKLTRLKKHALKVRTIGSRRIYERAYRDFLHTSEELTREILLQQVDLELLAVKEWKVEPKRDQHE